ncbi:MAG: methyltransferase domain-containing protein [Propionicimonas sp.]|uniref:class I SAM-dependent methyltransferase n=1 Tax=Propionicimonas sp. TaxID=1955623 RepID=UPI003D0D3DB1
MTVPEQRTTPAGDVDYEATGVGYAGRRRPDPRIAALVHAALGDARTVVNVGAGAGSYEPADRDVVAVEPSAQMRAQRPHGSAPVVDATAENLPFPDGAFEAAMATVTIHQWRDPAAGLRELRRVSSGPVVVLTFDPAAVPEWWLDEYVPELFAAEAARYPTIDAVCTALGGVTSVARVLIPLDCTDGFTEAFYGRPEAFLDPAVRAAQSAWNFADPPTIAAGLDRLAADLASGAWDARHGHLRSQPWFHGAVRLVVAVPDPPSGHG